MKLLLLALAGVCGLSAQQFTFTYTNAAQTDAYKAVTDPFPFPDTAVGSASPSVIIKVTNNGPNAVYILATQATTSSDPHAVATPNFSVQNALTDQIVAAGTSRVFTLSFTPTVGVPLTGYLSIPYQLASSIDNKPGGPTYFAGFAVTGNGVGPQWLLTYNNGTILFPNAAAPFDFGSVSVSGSTSITFTLTNESGAAIDTPSVTVNPPGVFTPSAFSVDISGLSSTLLPNQPQTFKVTFSPGQASQTSATLVVGSNSYPLKGTGVVVSDIDALQIYYVDATGVRTLPQAATPISFGQIVPGSAASTLTFTVANPQTSFNAITVPTITVTGAAFTLAGLPTLPASIQPGASITFTVGFNATSSGTYTGTLAIGSRSFSLTGLAVVSPVPSLSFRFSSTTPTSGQQVTLTVQAATASTGDHLGTLTMTFTPSVANVTDDPAIVFLATNSRTLSLELSPGAQTATYQGQSAIKFQTGTTAGTITFTLSFTNTPPLTQSFTITPAQIHISTASAVRQDPYLVVTVNGFDNTYSAGKMSFTFYDLKGKVLNSTPLAVDATTDFHNYFFTSDQAGGAFAMQAKFPVTGDVTQIGSVAVTLNNSAGQTSSTLPAQ